MVVNKRKIGADKLAFSLLQVTNKADWLIKGCELGLFYKFSVALEQLIEQKYSRNVHRKNVISRATQSSFHFSAWFIMDGHNAVKWALPK